MARVGQELVEVGKTRFHAHPAHGSVVLILTLIAFHKSYTRIAYHSGMA